MASVVAKGACEFGALVPLLRCLFAFRSLLLILRHLLNAFLLEVVNIIVTFVLFFLLKRYILNEI